MLLRNAGWLSKRLYGVISEMKELFITIAVRISVPTDETWDMRSWAQKNGDMHQDGLTVSNKITSTLTRKYRVILNYCQGFRGQYAWRWRRLWTTLQTVVCGVPNCTEAPLVGFCGLRDNPSWIRPTSSCEELGLPAPFRCRTRPVSWYCFNQHRIALSEGRSFPFWVL
jgi:hypothetical protein